MEPAADDESKKRAHDLVQAALIGDALDAGPALVFIADDQRRYVAVNRRACETLGFSREELLALRVTDVAVAPDAGELYAAMVHDQRQSGVTRIRCKDGRLLSFRYEAAETRVGGMDFFVAIGFVEDDARPPDGP